MFEAQYDLTVQNWILQAKYSGQILSICVFGLLDQYLKKKKKIREIKKHVPLCDITVTEMYLFT